MATGKEPAWAVAARSLRIEPIRISLPAPRCLHIHAPATPGAQRVRLRLVEALKALREREAA